MSRDGNDYFVIGLFHEMYVSHLFVLLSSLERVDESIAHHERALMISVLARPMEAMFY